MSSVLTKAASVTSYALTAASLVPMALSTPTISQSLSDRPKLVRSVHTEAKPDFSDIASPIATIVVNASNPDLVPSLLLPIADWWSGDTGQDDFVVDEFSPDQVTYLRAARVVEESRPDPFFDERDVSAIGLYDE